MTTQLTPREPFTGQTEELFDRLINDPEHKNKARVNHEKKLSYRHWLRNPTDRAVGSTSEKQKQYNEKNRALTLFELRDGQLWRRAHCKEPAKYVVCTYEVFERIKATHLQLEHAGITKTFQALQERYYGISKDEVTWLLQRCQNCL
ncbi:MAG: Rad2 nuclease, partial [Watsoniomyces obsoletus]